MEEVGGWLPQNLSRNGMGINPRLQLLIFLFYVTSGMPIRHLAVAVGVKRTTCQFIIRNVVTVLVENGFINEWITVPTEVSIKILLVAVVCKI